MASQKAIFLLLVLVFAVVKADEKIVDGFNEEERLILEKDSEKFSFNADISRLMDIIINSLYTHKEVFIRELISNSSDACEKVRFFSIQNPEYLGNKRELDIRVEFDENAKTFSITDTGVGMTRNDMIKNLGTIAKTGTTQFIEAISKGNSLNLIGQFGVGFYSTYLVSNKVVVTSKNNEDENQNVWISTAGSYFTISSDPRGNTLERGTRVTLYLKEDSYEFVEEDVIKKNIKKFSEFINFPIYVRVNKTFTREEVIPEEPKNETTTQSEETKTEEKKEENQDELEIKDEEKPEEKKEEKKEAPKTKTVTDWRWEWELINENKPVWLRSKSDITKDEYHKFYKTISKDNNDPASYDHGQAEGEVHFKYLYYIPSVKPQDLFDDYYGKNSALKLYVRRVLVSDQFEDLLPRYMNFVKGIVDSDDLPLNVSREQLQQHKMIKVMSKSLVRNVIKLITRLANESADDDEEEEEEVKDENAKEEEKKEETKDTKDEKKKKDNKYLKFFENFGKNLKLGVLEDSSNKTKLAKLLRFYSAKNPKNLISFDDYIKNHDKDMKYIYYIAGEDRDQLRLSPLLQRLMSEGYDILLLDDPIDEFVVHNLSEYEKKKFQNVAKGPLKIDETEEKARKGVKIQDAYKPLITWWSKRLEKRIQKMAISRRLVETPAIVVAADFGPTANMERIQKAQAFIHKDPIPSKNTALKIMEINPSHPAIKELLKRIKEQETPDEETIEISELIYESAMLASGFSLLDPIGFSERMDRVVKYSLNLKKDEPIEKFEVKIDDVNETPQDNSMPDLDKLEKIQEMNVEVPVNTGQEAKKEEVKVDL